MHLIGFRVILRRIKAIKFMMRDKSVPLRKKALVVFGIIYLFLPIDIIPIVIFPVSWIDDFILWVWILWHLRDTLDAYWIGEKATDLSREYRDKNVINDVDFKVEKDKE